MIYFATLLKALWKPIAFIAALIWVRWLGGRNAKLKADAEAGKRYTKQRRAIDEALETMGDDPATLRNAMRVRGERTE
jgi:hypothetical protein